MACAIAAGGIAGGAAWALMTTGAQASQDLTTGTLAPLNIPASSICTAAGGATGNNADGNAQFGQDFVLTWDAPDLPVGATLLGYTVTQRTTSANPALATIDWSPWLNWLWPAYSYTKDSLGLYPPLVKDSVAYVKSQENADGSTISFNIPPDTTSVRWGVYWVASVARTVDGTLTVNARVSFDGGTTTWTTPSTLIDWHITYSILAGLGQGTATCDNLRTAG
ncbi:MAG: hypothetical protein LBH13_10030 [Cellulomonadaceae bacterium]|nr:hypothetical protein [Cellulomonadaceae bacterium]